MAQSDIITGQYVQIQQTPASVGERIGAQVIDWLIQGAVGFTFFYLMTKLDDALSSGVPFPFWLIFLLIIIYCPLCEIFNHGQTIGKHLLKMRVIDQPRCAWLGSSANQYAISLRCAVRIPFANGIQFPFFSNAGELFLTSSTATIRSR